MRHRRARSVHSPIRPLVALVLLAATLVVVLPPSPASAWYDNNYLHKKAITIDHTKVSGGTNLTSFPVLISMTDAALKTTANGGSVQNANGYDIIFTDSSESTKLDHQIEHYVATTGEIEMWVRIPTLSVTADTVIYIYYDNAAISTSQENATSVWDSNYLGVWHMNDNAPNTTVGESSSNANTGTAAANTSTKTTAGKIANGLTFNGTSDNVNTTSAGSIKGQSQVTISAWINPSAPTNGSQQDVYFEPTSVGTSKTKLVLDINGGTHQFELAGRPHDADSTRTVFATNTAALSASTWYYVVGVFDSVGGTHHLMVNGTDQTTNATVSAFDSTTPVHTPEMGEQADATTFFPGVLNEVHLSKTVRSVGWSTTEYNNQSSPSTFFSVGSVVNRPGALTSLSVGTENPYTSATGTQYDWNFTTATTATLSRVQMAVPAGTSCSTRYLAVPGVASNFASTPDSVANSITGDLDVRAKVKVANWSTATGTVLAKDQTSGQFSWRLYYNASSYPELDWSTDGTTNATADGGHTGLAGANAGAAVSTANNGNVIWVRATLQVSVGGHPTEKYYTSTDGSTWTQLGSTQTLTTTSGTSIYDSTSQVEVSSYNNGASGYQDVGNVYSAQLYSGVGGTLENSFDPSLASATAASSWTASTGETWTVHQSGTTSADLSADIACDLTVSSSSGVPSGGTATVRLISDVAVYVFTPTSTNSGTASVLKLSGFTNTTSAGSYASAISTYDNSATPMAIDVGSASSLIFFTPSSSNLTSTSMSISSPHPSQTSVAYTLTASNVTLSSAKCFKINFSTTTNQTGVKPTAMSISSAALDPLSTWAVSPASWTVSNDNTSGTVTLTYATGATPGSASGRTLVLDGITNSSAAGIYYGLVNSYANTDCKTGPLDDMSVSFSVANTPPDVPTSIAQYKSDGSTSITTGTGWSNDASGVVFKATVSDSADSEQVRLCVENTSGTFSSPASPATCGSLVNSGSTASVSVTGLSANTQYRWQVKTEDANNIYSASYAQFNSGNLAYGFDTTSPTTGAVYDGPSAGVESGFNNGSLSTLSCNWAGFSDAGSGIASYDYSFGTTAGATDILGWTNVASSTTNVTASSLTLHTGQMYFCNVRANDVATNQSSVVSSSGQLVAPTLTFTTSTNSVNLPSLSGANSYTSTQTLTLTTSTNAYSGYVIRAFETAPMTAGSNSIADYSAPASAPTTWSGNGFGYTLSGGSSAAVFSAGTKYAHFGTSGSPDTLVSHSGPVSGSAISTEQETVTFKVATSVSQAAAFYKTSVELTCLPIY